MKINYFYYLYIILIISIFVLIYTPIEPFKTIKKGKKYKFYKKEHEFQLDGKYPILKKETGEKLIKLLEDLSKILDENEIPYWLTSGNLLGAVRHKGLIPWDDDIDINIPLEYIDKMKKVVIENKMNYYKARGGYKIFNKNSYPFIDIVVVEKEKDIWKLCYPLNEDNSCSYKTAENWPQECFDDEDVFPLTKIPFENFEVNAPKNFKKLIFKMYGDNCLEKGYHKKIPIIINHKFNHILYMLNLIEG